MLKASPLPEHNTLNGSLFANNSGVFSRTRCGNPTCMRPYVGYQGGLAFKSIWTHITWKGTLPCVSPKVDI